MKMSSIYLTEKCKCENPNIHVIETRKVKSGKRFGQYKYLMRCCNCKAQWMTFKTPDKPKTRYFYTDENGKPQEGWR